MVKTETEIKKIILQYVNHLKKEIKVDKVILYGSYAKGTASDESDIDIAVQSSDFSKDYLAECERLNRNVWRSGVDFSLEPRPLHPVLEDFFIDEILKTGKVVYEDSESDYPNTAS